MDRGMQELTGADDATSAWRRFFEPGDVVGIKMNPVGNPLANSSSELMLEVIDGPQGRGRENQGHRRLRALSRRVHYRQDARGRSRGYRMDRAWGRVQRPPDSISRGWIISGPTTSIGSRATTPTSSWSWNSSATARTPVTSATRQSHLGLLVTRRVNKIVLLPVLKDHGSAGVTGALKNMSHGLVNNVCRSHSTPDTNVCNQFIPAGGRPPGHSQEVRLAHHGRDQGRVSGRPGASRPEWTWENNALLLATDPVAMDHVALENHRCQA